MAGQYLLLGGPHDIQGASGGGQRTSTEYSKGGQLTPYSCFDLSILQQPKAFVA